jgi:hypothetical protein
MAKPRKQVEEFAKSPKAKSLEKKMLRRAEDPKTREKIAKRFKKLRKDSRSCAGRPKHEMSRRQGARSNRISIIAGLIVCYSRLSLLCADSGRGRGGCHPRNAGPPCTGSRVAALADLAEACLTR